MLQKRHFFPFLWRKVGVQKFWQCFPYFWHMKRENSISHFLTVAYPIILTSAPICPVWKEVSCGWATFHISRDLYIFSWYYSPWRKLKGHDEWSAKSEKHSTKDVQILIRSLWWNNVSKRSESTKGKISAQNRKYQVGNASIRPMSPDCLIFYLIKWFGTGPWRSHLYP